MLVKYFLFLRLESFVQTVLHEFGFLINNDKLDVFDSLKITVTVSQRRHLCHCVTDLWLLRSITQTRHLSL